MRCARCEFENIPGQTRCIRCGSILELDRGVVAVHPPRMPAWQKPWRDLTRRLRGWHLAPRSPVLAWVSPRLAAAVSTGVAGVVFSVIPGLAHLFAGRLREVRLPLLLWPVVLGAGLFFYGSSAGFLLLGLAIGIHAWIAIEYGLFRELGDLFARFGAALLVVVLLAVLYWATPRVVVPSLTMSYTALTIPALQIHSGDSFFAWRQEGVNVSLPRGALVLIRPQGLHFVRGSRSASEMRPMIGQVVGLPGERIQIRDGVFAAGEERLDPSSFPVPRWLLRYDSRVPILVPADSYFISSEYTIAGRVGLTSQAVGGACLVKAAEICGRPFLQWWPLNRRRFLE